MTEGSGPINLDELSRDFVEVDERTTVREVRNRVASGCNVVYIVVQLANEGYAVLRLFELVWILKQLRVEATSGLLDMRLSAIRAALASRSVEPVESGETDAAKAREAMDRSPNRRLVVVADGQVLGVLTAETPGASQDGALEWLFRADKPSPPARAAPYPTTRGPARGVPPGAPDVDPGVGREGWAESAPPPDRAAEPPPVLLGASTPRAARPGDEFTARFVAYVPDAEAEVQRMLERLSPRSESHLGVQRCRWAAGTRVTVKLSGNHLQVDPPEDEFVWEGDRSLIEFDVEVDRDAPEGATTLRYDVFIGTFRVARLRVELEIRAAERDTRQATVAGVEPVRTVFASYASRDRDRVLDMVSAIVNRVGLDVFLDCMDLNPGEQWKQRLESEIRARDQFLLFWSEHARASPWVDWEWRTALAQKGRESLDVQPLQPPQLAPPPDELSDLHFNDRYMLVRTAFEAMRGTNG
jgi:hypothetical protein